MLDMCTSWGHVECLEDLKARATFEALFGMLAPLGEPDFVCNPNAANVAAGLIPEFPAAMGTTPRFSTPHCSRSNELVNLWNRIFKSTLFHNLEYYESQWEKHVLCLL